MYDLNEIFEEISKDAFDEITDEEKDLKNKLKDEEFKKFGIMKNAWLFILNKLLGKLKIRVILYWNDKEVFNYIIPKN